MSVTETAFDENVKAYTLQNSHGTSVTILDYGAIIQSILFCGKEMVLGHDDMAGYRNGTCHFGATIGRFCNRIAGAEFDLNGKNYKLAKNDGNNHLHGGLVGFERHMWNVKTTSDTVICSRLSPDGEDGYPGNLEVTVSFCLTEDDALQITYDAVCDADTIVNMTNHSYFNLKGEGTALDHVIWAPAKTYVENDAENIPTGQILSVEGTPFDFRRAKELGQDVDADDIQLKQAKGYDHTLICQEIKATAGDISLHVTTDRPGIHLYSANYTHEEGRHHYVPRDGVCFESHLFADSIHHPEFVSPILRAGEKFHTTTCFHFMKE